MKNSIRLLVLCVFSITAQARQVEVSQLEPITLADRFEIKSERLNEKREFYISLPKDYQQSQKHYPVLYLLDGDQNIAQAVASARMLAQWRGIPELIIVAIPAPNRIRDYTPTNVEAYSAQSGGGDNFMYFIKHELTPYIDAHYPTHPYRILFGHSLSGLLAADELLKGQSDFNAFIITAPSLWWNDFAILKQAKTEFNKRFVTDTAVYFGIGALDGYGMQQELKQFVDSLAAAKNSKIRFQHKVYPDEGHMSAPMSVTYDGLVYVFSDIAYTEDKWQDFSKDGFMQREQTLLNKYGETAIQTAENYVGLGNYLQKKGDYAGAVAVFKINAQAYPGFAPNNSRLANAYVLAGDTDNARKEYKRAYEIAKASINGQGNAEQYLQQIALLDNPVSVSNEILDTYNGCYSSDDATFYIVSKNGTLLGKRQGWRDFELFPKSNEQFFMRVSPGYGFSFKQTDMGYQLILDVYGTEYILPKHESACETLN
ncbi:alpha/beta hydrolase-fold protein [Neptunicella marina]|uniref:Alpha/beta hydrolase n=1 Tax=Neptunicella marina TaxID=2125989 RepID=A0A8J6LVE8_9ALTE|nr:alpha/beta hydrolase-fold protein [Neptunicella marina]MBC3764529.1 hypothetical protein [Neptunicella marina]